MPRGLPKWVLIIPLLLLTLKIRTTLDWGISSLRTTGFLQYDFEDLVSMKWIEKTRNMPENHYSIDGWHGSLTTTNRFLEGWHKQLIGAQKKGKLPSTTIGLAWYFDRRSSKSLGGLDERYEVEKKLEHIYHLEEVYWKQRTSMRCTIKGDSNSRFYHLYSNGHRRKLEYNLSFGNKCGVCMWREGPDTSHYGFLPKPFWYKHNMQHEVDLELLE